MIWVGALLGLGLGALLHRIALWMAERGAREQGLAGLVAYPTGAQGSAGEMSLRIPAAWQGPAIMIAASAYYGCLWGLSRSFSQGIMSALYGAILLLIADMDLCCRRIPNMLVGPAALLALLSCVLIPGSSTPGQRIGSALLGSGLALLPFLFIVLIRPGAMGGGDVKLAALVGLMAGYPWMLWPICLGITAGAIVSVILIAGRRCRLASHIAYGPFLCFGAMLAQLYNPISQLLARK